MQLRSDHVAILFVLALANAVAKPVAGWVLHGSDALNPVAFLCAVAGVYVWWQQTDRTATIPVAWVLPPAVFLMILPSSFAGWASVALVAGYLLLRGGRSRRARAALLVVLAAALRTPIAESAMAVLSDPLLSLDAVLANMAGAAFGGGGTLNHNMIFGADGHAVLVMSGCASFANVSNALLIWFTTVTLLRRPGRLPLVLAGVALTAGIVGINAVRLGAMTVSRETYTYAHDGFGSTLAELAMVGFILIASLPFLLASERSNVTNTR